jgi:hypothetical protein
MSQIITMFRESGVTSIIVLLWFLFSLALCVFLSIYYIVMECKKPGPSAVFRGGLAPSLAGVIAAALMLLVVPFLIDVIAGAVHAVPRSLLDSVVPEQRAALLASSMAAQINVPAMTMLGQVLLAIPFAVMAGLSLSVPFRRKRRLEAAETGGVS